MVFYENLIFLFKNNFDILILKIILKIYIILIYFQIKYTLKYNYSTTINN
jgi:hypothetical protein